MNNFPLCVKLGMGRSEGQCYNHLRRRSRVICSQFGGEKATEVWLFDFGLRVGITAIEASSAENASRSGYAKLIHCGLTTND